MVDLGELPQEYLTQAYKCVGCGRSEQACALGNPVSDVLNRYRAKAFANMAAPKGLYDYCQQFSKFNGPFSVHLKKRLLRYFPAEMSAPRKRGVYFPGCMEIYHNPTGIKKTLDLFKACGAKEIGLYQEPIQCCGAPLYLAGDIERFREVAEVNGHLLNEFEYIVSNDPHCLLTLKQTYAEVGVPLRAKIFHFSQFIGPALASLRIKPRIKNVAYHDPCTLGRKLGIYEEPRQIIRWVTGHPPIEFNRHREESYCCGAGGLLPITHPDLSAKITQNRLDEFYLTGATTIVTASLGCALQLKSEIKQGTVVELKDFLLEALRG